jgi:hemoglobin-like flavoprotein
MDEDVVARSLELLAERVGDPAPRVYARLLARHPGTEALFLMDPGGHVRGQMLAVAIEALLDRGGEGRLAGLVGIERMNHVNIGVPPEVFDGFFALLMEVVRDALGPDWTAGVEEGWRRRLAEMEAETAGAAA